MGKKQPLGGDASRISVFKALECSTVPGVARFRRAKF